MKNPDILKSAKAIFILIMLMSLSFLQGCMYYYKIQTFNNVTPQEIKKYDSLNKYLILHQGSLALHVSILHFSDQGFEAKLSALPFDHLYFQKRDQTGGIRYKRKHQRNVLQEVHLYLADTQKIDTGAQMMIPYSSISKTEVYKKAVGRTTVSWVLPPLLVTAILVSIGAIIAASLTFQLNGL